MATQLKRELHFWDSVAINVGIIIGVGIFRVPSEIAKHVTSIPLSLTLWVLGGLASLVGVLCYAELSSRIPQTGGTYVFLRETYGKGMGFLYAWAEVAILRPASIASVAYVFSDYFLTVVPLPVASGKALAVFVILLLTCINSFGVKSGTHVQNTISFVKVAMLLLLAGLIFLFASKNVHSTYVPELGKTSHYWLAAFIPIFFTYGGWHEAAFMAGEMRDSKRELPWSLIASVLIVTFAYVTLNAAYLYLMPPSEIVKHPAIATSALEIIFGVSGKQIAGWLIVISTFGALSSNILTGARIPFALAQDAERIKWLSKVHPKFQTPIAALVLNGVWACCLLMLGNFEQLLFFSGFALRFFFMLTGISVFILRARQKDHTGFSMLGYPVVPILFSLASLALCIISIQYAPRESLIGALLILAGVPVYWFSQGRKIKR